MIAYLEGTVLLSHADYLVMKTTGGVGYQVYVPQVLLIQASEKVLSLHIHTHIRENDITLYGFSSLGEKQLFEMLIKTSGVGPKLGMAVLSVLRPQQLIQAIQSQNVGLLNSVPGIGKKTAAKLCLDMNDHLKKAPVVGLDIGASTITQQSLPASHAEELVSALTNMGFSERDVLSILGQVQAEAQSFEEQFKKALALLTSIR